MTSHAPVNGIAPGELPPALAALEALEAGNVESLQVLRASSLAAQHYPRLDPAQPVLLLGPADAPSVVRLQAVLAQAYGPDHPTKVLGTDSAITTVGRMRTLGSLREGAHLFIAPRHGACTYEALQDIAAHLRAPEGCPWDRELTWARLRAHLLEETHELLAALDSNDARKVSEELGDLLLQVAMQTQIAAEEGLFRFPDVVEHIVSKLIRRHPHVFGDAVVSGTDEVLANWEAIKRAERAQKNERKSPLSGIPAGLPALAQADAYLDRMSRIREPETPEAPWAGLAALEPGAPVAGELVGDALFGLVAWARAHGVEAESALREANARYARRVEEEEG
jgi:tetrapyrrole methylase family protein/MazG family protein